MSRTNWKQCERDAAALIGGVRFPANTGNAFDCESERFLAQVKNRRVLSLTELETLALSMEELAGNKGKLGLVMVKRSAGSGIKTPWLVCMTGSIWKALNV